MLFTSLWAVAAGLFPGSRQRMNESVFSRKLASSRTLIVDCGGVRVLHILRRRTIRRWLRPILRTRERTVVHEIVAVAALVLVRIRSVQHFILNAGRRIRAHSTSILHAGVKPFALRMGGESVPNGHWIAEQRAIQTRPHFAPFHALGHGAPEHHGRDVLNKAETVRFTLRSPSGLHRLT